MLRLLKQCRIQPLSSLLFLSLLVFSEQAIGQCSSNSQCGNYGVCTNVTSGTNGTCSCPVGYGGATCLTALCGDPLVDNSARGAKAGNASCTCDAGFTGFNCNICQNNNACQSMQSTTANAASTETGLDSSLVCNTSPYTYTTTYVDCAVDNSLLSSVFPGRTILSFTKIVTPQTTNSTSIAVNEVQSESPDSTYAYISHQGTEQFYCHASSCVQASSTLSAIGQSGGNSTTWTCANLNCSCIPNTQFCGGTPGLDLTTTLDSLIGPLDINCDNTQNGTCTFAQATLKGLFGPNGLVLTGCQFGECVSQGILSTAAGPSVAAPSSNALSGGVIAGLAVLGTAILLFVLLIMSGWWVQKRARRGPYSPESSASNSFGLAWSDVTYSIKPSAFSTLFPTKTVHEDLPEKGIARSEVEPTPSLRETQNTILKGISSSAEAGTVTAILGPSGAGKTTLVELLAERKKGGHLSGRIGFRSRSNETLQADSHLLAFVDQEDHLPPWQTVREALLFAARLSLPEPMPDLEKAALVDDLIQQLGLQAVAHNRIGHAFRRGISGGEKRRLSIGLALVAKPKLLILDEPTSGLDAVSARGVIAILTDLAHTQGTTVLLTVHQPSSQIFHSFDSVILISLGRLLYDGSPTVASGWLKDHGRPVPAGFNVADQLMEAAFAPDIRTREGEGSAEMTSGDRESANGKSSESDSSLHPIPHPRPLACFFTQLQALSKRESQNLVRDRFNVAFIVIGAIIGVFVGGLFYQVKLTIGGFQNRVGVFFFLCSLIAFASLSSLVRFAHAKPLFKRERSAALYHPLSWLSVYVVFDVIFIRTLPNLVMSLIIYWMAGLAHSAAAFFKYWLIVFILTVIVVFFNMTLAAITPEQNSHVAIVISSAVILFNVGFSGYGLNLQSIPGVLRWIQYMAPLKYSLEALTVNDVASSNLQIQDSLEGVAIDVSAVPILQILFGFNLDNYYRDLLILMAFLIGLAVVLSFVVCKYVKESK